MQLIKIDFTIDILNIFKTIFEKENKKFYISLFQDNILN